MGPPGGKSALGCERGRHFDKDASDNYRSIVRAVPFYTAKPCRMRPHCIADDALAEEHTHTNTSAAKVVIPGDDSVAAIRL